MDRKILRNIKKILVLAQRAHAHLQSKKISKAKRELKKIIKIDLDELGRLQQQNGMVLEDCAVVFKEAQTALNGRLNAEPLFSFDTMAS